MAKTIAEINERIRQGKAVVLTADAMTRAVKELGAEKAREITLDAMDEYGRLAAEAVTKKIRDQGLEPVLANYKAGRDLPSMGWESGPGPFPEDRPYGKSSRVTRCPLAQVWKSLGRDGERLGRLYCRVDQAKYNAYGKGYRCFHDKNVLDGDDCCIVRVELDGPEDR